MADLGMSIPFDRPQRSMIAQVLADARPAVPISNPVSTKTESMMKRCPPSISGQGDFLWNIRGRSVLGLMSRQATYSTENENDFKTACCRAAHHWSDLWCICAIEFRQLGKRL